MRAARGLSIHRVLKRQTKQARKLTAEISREEKQLERIMKLMDEERIESVMLGENLYEGSDIPLSVDLSSKSRTFLRMQQPSFKEPRPLTES